MITEFIDDDPGYIRWLAANPQGFVVNTYRQPNPSYLILHLATCRTIARTPARGKRWTFDYAKVCAQDPAELRRWARERVGGTLVSCGICNP